MRGSRLTLQAWDRTRNWSRRLTAITEATNARLELTVERFARREGQLFLLDLGRRSGAELGKRSGRLVFRERFRLFLRRQFPEWNLAEVSAEADLEHSPLARLPARLPEARAARLGRHRLPARCRRRRRCSPSA